jgi:soluble lytic murein transglycosylase-like protein
MKKHTRWIAVYVGVVLALALFTGLGIDRENISEAADNNFLSGWEPSADPVPIYELGEYDIQIDELDILMRMDLGYPRIERILNSYEDTIRRYADRYGFDWRLILAVMNQESRFRVQAVSHRGAYGLMQIMPITGKEVSNALGIEGVVIPEDNIAGGVYYLWRMHTLFSKGTVHADGDIDYSFDGLRLALAAYNGGPSRIRDAQHLARYLNLDPYRWDTIRDLLPMLSRRYSSLHAYVWDEGIPTGGYFEGYNETLNYVDRTVEYYAYYRQMFE